MTPIQLDLSKLLGFKIVASDFGPYPQQVSIGAKLGEKEGVKPGGKASIKIGAKLGEKVGGKNP
jgi:hypothetical protein